MKFLANAFDCSGSIGEPDDVGLLAQENAWKRGTGRMLNPFMGLLSGA